MSVQQTLDDQDHGTISSQHSKKGQDSSSNTYVVGSHITSQTVGTVAE